jgi:NAD-dependent SIR2 family protein deacetylase
VGEKLICHKCGLEMTPSKTVFNYMGFTFNTELPRCPKCGLLYIPEDIVNGKMDSVEMELEEK